MSEWQTKNVGAILQLEYGKPLNDTDRKHDGLYPVYGANGEKSRSDKFYYDKPTIIVGRKGSAGELNLTESKFWPLDVTYFVTFDEQQHDLRFLYYLLMTLDLPHLAKGIKPGINRNEVYSKVAKIPSLSEQQRIVRVLDEAFEGISTAKANAEKNLQNARALFESHLNIVFKQCGNGCLQKSLGEVCNLYQGLCINAKTKHLLVEKSSLPLLRIKDLRNNSTELFIADNGWPKNTKVSESDIIYTRTGQIGLVFRGRIGILHNNCFKVIPKPILTKDYLFWWLQTSEFRARITALASKAAQPDISHSLFKVQPILLPSLEYQKQSVIFIDKLVAETHHLQSIYERKLASLESLKKSLLHQAFTGNL